MEHFLPMAKQLEKLPMRALVAYAARTARRLSLHLNGAVPEDCLDDVLRLVESVSTARLLAEMDPASVVRAGERVASAYASAPESIRTGDRFRVVFSITHAALVAMHVLLAAGDPSTVQHQVKCAAQEAFRAVLVIEKIADPSAQLARENARRDYDILLQEYGEHDEPAIGDPITLFGS